MAPPSHFNLPRSHDKPEAAVLVGPPSETPAQIAGTVLLVEDNGDVAEVGAGLLRELAYRVRSVVSAQAALAALRLDPEVDLVFSDILMPGGKSGIDLARDIGDRYPDIPVLLTTGYSASAQDAVARGVVVLQKPYDLEGLRRHISEAIESAKAPQAKATRSGAKFGTSRAGRVIPARGGDVGTTAWKMQRQVEPFPGRTPLT